VEVQARRRQARIGTNRPPGKVRVGLFEHGDKWKDICVLTLDVPGNARMCGKSSLCASEPASSGVLNRYLL
jgi:hypothetical protein